MSQDTAAVYDTDGQEDIRGQEFAWCVGFRVKGQRTIKVVAEYLDWDSANEMTNNMLRGWPIDSGIEVYYFDYETTHLSGVSGKGRFEIKGYEQQR